MSDGKKYFVLMENGKDTSQVFASKQLSRCSLEGRNPRTFDHPPTRARHQACPRFHGQHLDGPPSLLAVLTGCQI